MSFEKKNLEKELGSFEAIKELFHQLDDLVIVQDTDNTILLANDNVCRSLSLDRKEVVGKKCFELWENRENVCDDCPIPSAIASKKEKTINKRTTDGRWWRIWCRPVLDQAGKCLASVGIGLLPLQIN